MIPSLSKLLATSAGKVAAGVVVATMSVGAAAAAGAPIPFAGTTEQSVQIGDEPADEPQEEPAEEPEEEPAEEQAEEPAEELEEEQAEEPAEEPEEEPAEEPEEEPAEDVESDDPTHGDVVSGFVHETELEGCWKGQATAAVARGDIEPDEEGAIDPADVDEYLSDLDKCGGDYAADDEEEAVSDVDEEATQESPDDEDDGDDEDEDDDEGRGKPDQAGQRGAERSQGKAKGPNK